MRLFGPHMFTFECTTVILKMDHPHHRMVFIGRHLGAPERVEPQPGCHLFFLEHMNTVAIVNYSFEDF